MDRRRFLACSAAGFCGATFGAAFWRNVFAQPAMPGESPYGPISAVPDENGVRLPRGFKSRIVAVSGQPVPRTALPWHPAPDGGACFPVADGGWAYVSNSEVPVGGGVSMIRFDGKAKIVDARRLLIGSQVNCAGGPTPWGTWLSCEEWDGGHVWECYLDGQLAQRRLGLGQFTHEAAAVDPLGRALYLTEDEPDGRLYRFSSNAWPDLDQGTLQAASVLWDDAQRLAGTVRWVSGPHLLPGQVQGSARSWPTAGQTTVFVGGEGCWYDGGFVYFTTKGDNRVWSYNDATSRLEVIHDPSVHPGSPLRGVDNIVVSQSGDIYVAEDGGDMQLCIITPDRVVAPFLQLVGHDRSEITGPAFNPAGERLYFSSQRGTTGNPLNGATFEVRGPFRI